MNNQLLLRRSTLLLASAALAAASAVSAHTPLTRIDHQAEAAAKASGPFSATLATAKNQPSGNGLQVELTLTPYAGDPDECGDDSSVEVRVGDQVNLCYTLHNTSGQALSHQSLTDSVDGDLLAWAPIQIAPGQSHRFVRTIVATGDSTRSANWTGFWTLPAYAVDDTAAPNFIDISTTGSNVGFTPGNGDDNEFTAIQAGFPLRLYGVASTDLCVSNDGFIGFADPVCEAPSFSEPPPGYSYNAEIPVPVTSYYINVPGFLAPMWNNLYDAPGAVYVQTLGTAPNRSYVVQWDNLYHYAISTTGVTFQVVFEEATDTIRYEYRDTAFGNPADHGAWATVGLQGDPRGLYSSYSYYQPSLQPNSAIVWTYTPAVEETASSGSVSISAGDPVLSVTQSSLAGLAGPGTSTTATLSFRNDGNRDLNWSLEEAPGGSGAHLPRVPRYLSASANDTLRFDATDRPSKLPAHPGYGVASAPDNARQGGFSVPTYAFSPLRPGLVTFDALDPASTVSQISNNSDVIYAATFLDNDFSRLWVIVQDSWTVPPGTYGTVDTTTGAFTELGRIHGARGNYWSALTQDPLTGMVYSTNLSNNPFFPDSYLYTIDFATGRATEIGELNGPGIHPARYFPALAIAPDGLMYGVDGLAQTLIAINKQTAYATPIGSLGLNIRFGQGMTFDHVTGDLYWAALHDLGNENYVTEIRVLDPLTALSQPIATMPPAAGYPIDQFGDIAIARPAAGCIGTGEVPWLSIDGPTSGVLAPGATHNVQVQLDAGDLDHGLYEAMLCVFGDDPRRRAAAVAVLLAVMDPTPLHDQTVSETEYRLFNNTIVAPQGATALSAESADDFVVDGKGWNVQAVGFTAYGNPGHLPPATVNVRVLADNGAGAPGDDVVCSASASPRFSLGAPDQHVVFLSSACKLTPGTYWVAWSFANVDLTTPILGFAGAIEDQHGAPGHWRNPQGGLGFGCTTWSPFGQCGNLVDPAAHDLSFSVYATPVAPDCADVIWRNGFEAEPDACF